LCWGVSCSFGACFPEDAITSRAHSVLGFVIAHLVRVCVCRDHLVRVGRPMTNIQTDRQTPGQINPKQLDLIWEHPFEATVIPDGDDEHDTPTQANTRNMLNKVWTKSEQSLNKVWTNKPEQDVNESVGMIEQSRFSTYADHDASLIKVWTSLRCPNDYIIWAARLKNSRDVQRNWHREGLTPRAGTSSIQVLRELLVHLWESSMQQ